MKKKFKIKFAKLINNFNNSKIRGITLIALIITIIVLLILAGITISLVFGKNRTH